MNNLFDLHTLLEKEEPWPFFILEFNQDFPWKLLSFVLLLHIILDKKGVIWVAL